LVSEHSWGRVFWLGLWRDVSWCGGGRRGGDSVAHGGVGPVSLPGRRRHGGGRAGAPLRSLLCRGVASPPLLPSAVCWLVEDRRARALPCFPRPFCPELAPLPGAGVGAAPRCAGQRRAGEVAPAWGALASFVGVGLVSSQARCRAPASRGRGHCVAFSFSRGGVVAGCWESPVALRSGRARVGLPAWAGRRSPRRRRLWGVAAWWFLPRACSGGPWFHLLVEGAALWITVVFINDVFCSAWVACPGYDCLGPSPSVATCRRGGWAWGASAAVWSAERWLFRFRVGFFWVEVWGLGGCRGGWLRSAGGRGGRARALRVAAGGAGGVGCSLLWVSVLGLLGD